jgi:hypothetical protein
MEERTEYPCHPNGRSSLPANQRINQSSPSRKDLSLFLSLSFSHLLTLTDISYTHHLLCNPLKIQNVSRKERPLTASTPSRENREQGRSSYRSLKKRRKVHTEEEREREMGERRVQLRYKEASRDLLEARARLERIEADAFSLSSSSASAKASFRSGFSLSLSFCFFPFLLVLRF